MDHKYRKMIAIQDFSRKCRAFFVKDKDFDCAIKLVMNLTFLAAISYNCKGFWFYKFRKARALMSCFRSMKQYGRIVNNDAYRE